MVDFETAPLSAAWADGGFRTGHRVRVRLDFEATATDESPAIVRATILNPQAFEQTVETRWLHFFDDPVRSRTRDQEEAYFVPTSEHPFSNIDPPITRDEDGRWRLEHRPGTWYPMTLTLPAESGIEGDYYLLGNSDPDEPPIHPGTYEFGGSSFELAVWPEEPGPDGESSFHGADPPPLPDAEEMAWYHDADPADRVFLEPKTETVSLPDRVKMRFQNYAHEQGSGNPYYWRLYKLVEGTWFSIEPWMWHQPLMYLNPGDRVEPNLALFHDEPFSVSESQEIGFLGGGTYAYETGYALRDETHAAMFEIAAPAIDVEPPSDVTTAEDGETITATHAGYEDGDHPVTVTLSREDDVGAVDRTLIPEQLYRHPFIPYRTGIPLFDADVQRVDVRLDRLESGWSTILGQDDISFEYTDEVYVATTEGD